MCEGMELSYAIENCGKTNQEEAKGTYHENRGEEEDEVQGKSGGWTNGMDEGPICARDGHGHPFLSPCPSVFFFTSRIHLSVSVFFFNINSVCPSYGH